MKPTKQMQERVNDLTDDLMTVLESYMDQMGMDEVFYHAYKLMTYAMYECLDDHKLSLKTLRSGMDEGMKMHLQIKANRDHQ